MKTLKIHLIATFFIITTIGCSNEATNQNCPDSDYIVAKVNGENLVFSVTGRSIDLNNEGGHTLKIFLGSGVHYPVQDSYDITIQLRYKKTGSNVIDKIIYQRVGDGLNISTELDKTQIESRITVNKNTCFSGTFSGSTTVDGNAISIIDGVVEHNYEEPF